VREGAALATRRRFTDIDRTRGYAPIDVQAIDPVSVVTHALQDQDAHDDVKG
jgi:hypothetical protein